MCSFRRCQSIHSLLHINNAAEFISMGSLLADAPLDFIIRLVVGRRLLYLGIGYHHKVQSQVAAFNSV
jgi:hypothetical protein